MGAAYAKGFIDGLMSYANTNGLYHKIVFELDLAPFQSMSQKGNPNVNTTLTISHWDDGVAGPSFMLKANNIRTRFYGFCFWPTTQHSIKSFIKEILEYVQPENKQNGGKNKIWEENGLK